jgi:hypothetical protein
LRNCSVTIAEKFRLWEVEGKAWNNTFMILNTGSFSFINTEFKDILINGNYMFISANVVKGKNLIIDECIFLRCGCLDGVTDVSGAGMSIELSSDTISDKFKIKNTTFKDCIGKNNNIQIMYFKSEYSNKYLFDSLLFNYNEIINHPMIVFNLLNIPPTQEEMINNNEFQSKFINMCNIVNKTNILIKNTSQTFPLLDIICKCPDIITEPTCQNTETFSTKRCIWVNTEETGQKCQEIEGSCSEILRKETCLFAGAAKSSSSSSSSNEENLTCIWVNTEETGQKCQEIEGSCSEILRKETCLFPGAAHSMEGADLQCSWFNEKCVISDLCVDRTPLLFASPGNLSCGSGCVKSENDLCKKECDDTSMYVVDNNETSSTYGSCIKKVDKKSKQSNFPWWIFIIIAISILLLIIIIIIFFVVLYKKKKKKQTDLVKDSVSLDSTNQNEEPSIVDTTDPLTHSIVTNNRLLK